MANVAPAVVVITSTTGPGVTNTAQRFTDVVGITVDFLRNVIGITRSGSGSTVYYDYSAMATFTWTISGGLSTLTISS